MKVTELYRSRRHTFSFEFFPPKTPGGEANLFETVRLLKNLGPAYVSVTYGAMGTTRQNTLRIVSSIKKDYGIEAAAHLTCVGHSRDEIEAILEQLQASDIENIVALRGDPPAGETTYEPSPNGLRYASELVAMIRSDKRFSDSFALGVGGYPECHVECRDPVQDLEHLKIKVDAGADVIITQLFFLNEAYFDFVDRAVKAGITVPIVPGIMPVTHGPQIERFARMCGTTIPDEMRQAIEKFGADEKSIQSFGIDYAIRQCRGLLDGGVPGIHFYTLNKSRATMEIYKGLDLSPH